MLFGIVLLTIYFATARDLSFGAHAAAIAGLLFYFFVPLSSLPGLLTGWTGVGIALAAAAGFVAYHSSGAEARPREEPDARASRTR